MRLNKGSLYLIKSGSLYLSANVVGNAGHLAVGREGRGLNVAHRVGNGRLFTDGVVSVLRLGRAAAGVRGGDRRDPIVAVVCRRRQSTEGVRFRDLPR